MRSGSVPDRDLAHGFRRLTDDLGAKGSATVLINVHNDGPVAALSISPTTALTGETVTLSAAGSLDPDGAIAKYEWDIDGNGSYEFNSGAIINADGGYACGIAR